MLLAFDRKTSKRVVLKVMIDLDNPYRVESFNREAAILEHFVGKENVLQLVGGLERIQISATSVFGKSFSFSVPYFAVEQARHSLSAYLVHGRVGRPVYRRLGLLRDAVKGVARMHRYGYCHRDIKPDNILVFSGGRAKIADLGTCRLHSGAQPILGVYPHPVGSLSYAAPEMFAGGAAQPALFVGADWFSIGATLFESVTGINLYVSIGLLRPLEIQQTFAAAGNLQNFARMYAKSTGMYPIPSTEEFSETWLTPLRPKTHAATTALIRDLCAFNFQNRLTDYHRILGRLDVCIAQARHDHEKTFGVPTDATI